MFNEFEPTRPKSINCKTKGCKGRMHYVRNEYRSITNEWYEMFMCPRCNQQYVKGDPK